MRQKPVPKPVVESQEELKRRVVLGFGGLGVHAVILGAQGLILVPLFLSAWSAEVYRDWLVIFAATRFLSLLDLGTQYYLVNQMRMAAARGELGIILRTLHFGSLVYVVILLPSLLLVLGAAFLVRWPDVLNVVEISPGATLATLLGMACYLLVMIPYGFIHSVYRARGEFNRGIVVEILSVVLQTGAIVLTLRVGAPPPVVAAAYVAVAGIVWIVTIVDQRRRYPELHYGLVQPTTAELRAMASKAAYYMLIPLAHAMIIHGSILILSAMAPSAAAVVTFATLRTLAGVVRSLVEKVKLVGGNEMSRQVAQRDGESLQRFYATMNRLLAGLTGGLSGLIFVLAPPFVSFWTFGKVDYDPWVLGPLLAAILAVSPAQAAVTLFHFTNQPRYVMVGHLGHSIAGLALSLALVASYGAAGAAVAMACGEFVFVGLLVPWHARRVMKMPFAGHLIRGYATVLASLAVSYGLAQLLADLIGTASPMHLALVGIAWACSMLIPAFFIVLNSGQRSWLLSYTRKLVMR